MTETLPAPIAGAAVGEAAVTAPPSPAEWTAMKQQAAVIYRSGMAPRSIKSAEQVLVIALKGRELGIPPMQALSHIHVVEGKPTLSAELMAALVLRAGHRLRVVETSSESCTVEGERADDPDHPQRVAWTMEDARRAGVSNKGPWRSYPAAMLRARAISALCRFAFADVLMGASYTPEELGAEVDEEGWVVEATAVPADGDLEGEDLGRVAEQVVEEVPDEEALEELLEDALTEVSELLNRFDEGDVDKEKAWAYAQKGLTEARKTVGRLKQLLEVPLEEPPAPHPDEVEGVERGGAVQQQADKADLPATRKQLNYLESLLADVVDGDDGVARFEQMMEKPMSELTRAEASEWLGRLSGRQP